ncbi:uncharacterized protein LOC119081673 [Bradysia coprophila]|uniref:uncharacterized protein LOC119081673 n=1 Tax=Bradysia coprophila TaxID=38358 RepID=UPI00187D9034|nr:uncharacterized protein LOC119081673 [Bradysia coprophila]XP_037046653.1 uncharacterized protein LOC119081673 [Bradysia coprophila]
MDLKGSGDMSERIGKLQSLDGFNFGFSDANDPNENLKVETLVRVGSQIKEISIWAHRLVKKADKNLKAAGLLCLLGKTSIDKSEGDDHSYELHVMIPSVGLVHNPKMRRVLHACTGLERLILDRVSNLTILLSHNYPKLKEIEAYVMEDEYIFQLAQHYPTVQSVQLSFGCGSCCSVKRFAALKNVTDIRLGCDSDHNRDLFRLIREVPKVTFIDVTLSNHVQVNLLANLDFFPNLKKVSVHFTTDFGYGETFKNFLVTRGNMLELLMIDTHDFVDVPKVILENTNGISQLSCRFHIKTHANITKDQFESIFKIPVRNEKTITFKVSNNKEQKRIETLVEKFQPKSVSYKMKVYVVTTDDFHVLPIDELHINND